MQSKIISSKYKGQLLVGVDEAGRGPLAGPVTAAAVILHPKKLIKGLNDSKKLTKKQRDMLFIMIQQRSIAWAVGWASVAEIDKLNILQASLLAMQRAVKALDIIPDKVLIDGKHKPALPYAMEAIVAGDSLIPAISAASIMAKVSRDKLMAILDKLYPHYGFAQHQGYSTEFHKQQLEQLGPSAIHRSSFQPVKDYVRKTNY